MAGVSSATGLDDRGILRYDFIIQVCFYCFVFFRLVTGLFYLWFQAKCQFTPYAHTTVIICVTLLCVVLVIN